MKLKAIFYCFTTLTILTAAFGLYFYHKTQKNVAYNENRIVSISYSEAIKHSFSRMISNYKRITNSLSRHNELNSLLTQPSAQNLIGANKILDLYNSSLQTDVCYLMNTDGITVASSNRSTEDSFVGKNYAFRPYFKNSIKGKSYTYMAWGVTSKKRGIYFSNPVYDDAGTIVGVAVIKENIEAIEDDIIDRYHPRHAEYNDFVFIIDENGIIFISNDSDMLLHTLWELHGDVIDKISSSEQFGKGPWLWSGFKKTGRQTVIDRSGRKFSTILSDVSELSGWKIVHLSDLDTVSKQVASSLFEAAIYVIFFIAIVLISVLFILILLATRAEKALKDSEQRYRTTFDAIPDSITVTRVKDGRYQYVNNGFCSITGFSREEVIGKTPLDINLYVNHDDRKKMTKTLLKNGELLNFEIQFRRKNGTIWDSFFTARPIDIDGESHLIALTKDVTELKKTEKEKRRLESQLRQAQKMESVGRLAGGVAHDFNNMLSIILGNSEIMMEDIGPDHPCSSNLKEIQNAAQRSADLTRQLLAFARKQTISPKILNPNHVIESMLKMLKRLIGEDIDLLWRPQADLWPIKIDPSQIDQMLANLCVNARDAIKDVGKIIIETGNISFDEIYCKEHTGFIPGNYIVIVVSDNGCGMNRETTTHLFEPFFTTKKGEGTGLGLATVYGIVKQNNGFINAYSELNQGTTFKIYLPRYSGNFEQQAEKEVQKESPKGYETILLVEDEDAILQMTRQMLERLGYNILAASTPDEAIQIINVSGTKIDLLITDVVMPMMNGRELSEKILLSFPNMKCLYMSGYTANVIAHRGILDEGLYFINKPFSKQELSMKLREILD